MLMNTTQNYKNEPKMKNAIILLLLIIFATFVMTGCSNNYSSGERIGMVIQFSKTGVVFDSWEGQLNMTQTGMNSSSEFDFSLDNDKPELQDRLVPVLDSAAHYGWKVSLKYNEVRGYNWLQNRGETDHFINDVVVLDKNPIGQLLGKNATQTADKHDTIYIGHRDTVYVVIKR